MWRELERFLAQEITVREFGDWVYAHPEIERALGSPFYSDLVSFDYEQALALRPLANLVAATYETGRPGCLPRDRAYRLASGLLDGSIRFERAVRGLAALRIAGSAWIPVIFEGIDSELDDIPDDSQQANWEPSAFAAKMKSADARIENYRDPAFAAAREVLRWES